MSSEAEADNWHNILWVKFIFMQSYTRSYCSYNHRAIDVKIRFKKSCLFPYLVFVNCVRHWFFRSFRQNSAKICDKTMQMNLDVLGVLVFWLAYFFIWVKYLVYRHLGWRISCTRWSIWCFGCIFEILVFGCFGCWCFGCCSCQYWIALQLADRGHQYHFHFSQMDVINFTNFYISDYEKSHCSTLQPSTITILQDAAEQSNI